MSATTTSPTGICPWLCGPPQGPSTPFGNPELVVYDSLRVVCITAAVIIVGVAVFVVARRGRPIGQKVRYAASAGLAVIPVSVEIEHFGDYANWRLITALVALMAMAWGNYAGVRYEGPTQIR